MLSSIPVQLTDLPAVAGEAPSGNAPGPAAAGELVTFAELLRQPVAARSPFAAAILVPETVPALPPGGNGLPPAGDGEDPLAAGEVTFDMTLVVADSAANPGSAAPSPGALVPTLPAEYRIDARDPGKPAPSAARPTGATMPALAGAGRILLRAADGLPLATQGLPAGLSTPQSPVLPELPQVGMPASTLAADAPATLIGDDTAGTTLPGSRPNPLPEGLLPGLPHHEFLLPDLDGAGPLPQPVTLAPAAAGALPTATSPAAASSPAPPFTSTAFATLGVPVGDPAWGDALGDQLLVLAGKQVQRAEIRLHPAELGPVQIRITVEDDGATLAFAAQHAVTREAIEQALPRLRELFSDQGLSLLNTSVSEQGARQHDREPGLGGRGADPAVAGPGGPADADQPAPAQPRIAARHALIDMFA